MEPIDIYIGKEANPEETVKDAAMEWTMKCETDRPRYDSFIAGANWQKQQQGTYTTSEVLTMLRNMKELCVERLGQMPIVTHLTALKSILSINENDLLK